MWAGGLAVTLIQKWFSGYELRRGAKKIAREKRNRIPDWIDWTVNLQTLSRSLNGGRALEVCGLIFVLLYQVY